MALAIPDLRSKRQVFIQWQRSRAVNACQKFRLKYHQSVRRRWTKPSVKSSKDYLSLIVPLKLIVVCPLPWHSGSKLWSPRSALIGKSPQYSSRELPIVISANLCEGAGGKMRPNEPVSTPRQTKPRGIGALRYSHFLPASSKSKKLAMTVSAVSIQGASLVE